MDLVVFVVVCFLSFFPLFFIYSFSFFSVCFVVFVLLLSIFLFAYFFLLPLFLVCFFPFLSCLPLFCFRFILCSLTGLILDALFRLSCPVRLPSISLASLLFFSIPLFTTTYRTFMRLVVYFTAVRYIYYAGLNLQNPQYRPWVQLNRNGGHRNHVVGNTRYTGRYQQRVKT